MPPQFASTKGRWTGPAAGHTLRGVPRPGHRRAWRRLAFRASLAASALAVACAAVAQPEKDEGRESPAVEAAMAAASVEQSTPVTPFVLTYANRPVVTLRASILGRPPAERATAARLSLDRLRDEGVAGPVQVRAVGAVVAVEVAGHHVIAILPADVDALAGETPAGVARAAANRLEIALDEAHEADRPWELASGAVQVALASGLLLVLVTAIRRIRRLARQRLGDAAERRLEATAMGDRDFVRASRIGDVIGVVVRLLSWAVGLALAYGWLTFTLRRFPYTRPWGESLRGFLVRQLSSAGAALLGALPELFTVLLIVVGTRIASHVAYLFFRSVQQGRITATWVHPDTAESSRKLVTVLLWLFALAIAFPFLPGSDTDAFKGVSVFVGLMLSLGSSGLVNQVMSGFTLTYSRALRVGDFVSVGEFEGTVTHLGMLTTKLRTGRGEDLTLPNAVVVAQTVTNYTRRTGTDGVFVPTDVTIGYDVPWRQVQALLLMAAARTPGVRSEPPPRVRHAALEDSYVRYTLQFCLDHPSDRRLVLAAVHANVLDVFNEYGVQITSPNYEADPETPKVVPRERWFAAPAPVEDATTRSAR